MEKGIKRFIILVIMAASFAGTHNHMQECMELSNTPGTGTASPHASSKVSPLTKHNLKPSGSSSEL